MKFTPLLPLLGLSLVGCGVPGVFNGEWVRGDWDAKSAMADCQRIAPKMSYPAYCEVGWEWSADNNYGEVWLVNTNGRTKSGEEITKIWRLKRP